MADSLTRSRLAYASQNPDNERALLNQIRQRWEMYPGSRPEGSGRTGLLPSDAQGWSRLQDENIWALNALRKLENKGPLQVRSAPFREFHAPATAVLGGEGPGYATGVGGVASRPVQGGPRSSMSLAALRALMEER